MLHYRSDGLPAGDGYGLWRELMSPMYDIEPAGHAHVLPGGSLSGVLIDGLLANRTSFAAQRVKRGKKLISRTPDHLVLQLWRSGGTRGEVAGTASSYRPGQVALADRRLEVDSLITRSDTLGVVIPRSLLDGMRVDELPRHLDAKRNRLAAARITSLWRRVPDLEPGDATAVAEDFTRFFRRLFDPSQAPDVLEGAELHQDIAALAERVIDRNLGFSGLSPETIAGELGLSRAGLYRVFSPTGGIMRHVGQRRLAAVAAALADPLETRSVTRLAEEFGFSSLTVLSHAFRARFAMPPRDWRALSRRRWRGRRETTPDPMWRWFHGLGQRRPDA